MAKVTNKRWGRNPATGKPVLIASKGGTATATRGAGAPKKTSAKATKAVPAKKPAKAAAKKAAPKSDPDLLRGVALVDAAMAERRALGTKLQGMSEAEIAKIDLGGKPMSPALARWLAADGEMFTLGAPQSFAELCESELDEWADFFTDMAKYVKGPCVLFEGWGSDSRRFLYLGVTDEHGEYPVFTIDTDDTPFACINGPVDVWLAQQAEFLDEEEYYGFVPKEYEPARKAMAKLAFGGYIAFVDGVFSKQLDG